MKSIAFFITILALSLSSCRSSVSSQEKTSTAKISSDYLEEENKAKDKMKRIMSLVDKEDLRQHLESLNVSESDSITLVVSPEGEIVQAYATDVKVASTSPGGVGIMDEKIMLAPGKFLLRKGKLGGGNDSIDGMLVVSLSGMDITQLLIKSIKVQERMLEELERINFRDDIDRIGSWADD